MYPVKVLGHLLVGSCSSPAALMSDDSVWSSALVETEGLVFSS
jgi:hypothetical protein